MARDKHHRQGPQPKRYMLDMGRADTFKYQAKETIRSAEIHDDYVNPLTTTMFSKATREGTEAAKEYIEDKHEEGVVSESLRDDLVRLLDRYSRWR